MKRSISALLCTALAALTACGTDAAAAKRMSDDPAHSAQIAFSLNLLQQLMQKSPDENLLISPYSAMQALAMAANGAAGETLAGMETALGGLPTADLNACLAAQQNDEYLASANAVWIREGLGVSDAFLQKTRNIFRSEVFSEPFDSSSLDKINSWCSEHTNGMIPNLLSSVPADAAMYLMNASAFEAKWAVLPDSVSHYGSFYCTDGSKMRVTMMESDESVYLSDKNAEGFLRYYEGEKYAFAALLPEEGTDIGEYAASLTPERLEKILRNRKKREVRAGIPVFTSEYDSSLNEALSAMGMGQAFSEQADFSGILKNGGKAFPISAVLQKTFIEVNTEGTRASSVTMCSQTIGISDDPVTLQRRIILDRPFLYMILDTDTNLPVFLGILRSPQETKGDYFF